MMGWPELGRSAAFVLLASFAVLACPCAQPQSLLQFQIAGDRGDRGLMNHSKYHGVEDYALFQWLHIPVQEIWNASDALPGYDDVNADEDQTEVNRWNDVDMIPWLASQLPLSMDALWNMASLGIGHNRQATRRLVAIRRNKVYFLHQNVPPLNGPVVAHAPAHPVDMEVMAWWSSMKQFLEQNQFPDVVFFLSLHDWPSCPSDAPEQCPVPIMSYQKRAGWNDILIPRLSEMSHPLYVFNWKYKVDKGFMRATQYCHAGGPMPSTRCARGYLAQASQYLNRGGVLEAGLTTGYGLKNETDDRVLGNGPLASMGWFPLLDHSRYKFLVDTDGKSGSYRASKLMHFNSPILKEDSPWMEWYTRSLRDGVHHIKFWTTEKDDIFDLMDLHRDDDAALQEMTRNAMRFAYKYTSPKARMFYFRRALYKYKALFGPGMDEWMDSFQWDLADE